MSKTTAKSLASTLSVDMIRDASLESGFEYTVEQMSQFQLFTAASLISVDHTTETYTIPDDFGLLLQVFYDDEILSRESRSTILYYHPNWKDEYSTPLSYVADTETTKTFRLYPRPLVSSSDFTWLTGSPFGKDFPDYAVGAIHTEMRDDTPDWMDLPIALQILSKEFAQESRHKDLEAAKAAKIMSETLLSVINASEDLHSLRPGKPD